jgi:hypothetical protein
MMPSVSVVTLCQILRSTVYMRIYFTCPERSGSSTLCQMRISALETNVCRPARSLFLTLLQCTATSTAIKGLLVGARLRVQPDSGSAALSSSDRTGITATQHHFQSPSWRPGQGQHERGRRPPRAAEPEIVRVGGYGAWFRPGGQ